MPANRCHQHGLKNLECGGVKSNAKRELCAMEKSQELNTVINEFTLSGRELLKNIQRIKPHTRVYCSMRNRDQENQREGKC